MPPIIAPRLEGLEETFWEMGGMEVSDAEEEVVVVVEEMEEVEEDEVLEEEGVLATVDSG